MNKPLPYTVEEVLSDVQIEPQSLSEALFSNIADDLRDGVSSHTKIPIQQLSQQLVTLFNRLFKKALPSVRDAVRAKDTVPMEVVQAYKLGQVAFAQLFASQTAEQRAEDAFMDYLTQSANAAYFKALLDSPKTSQDLAAAIDKEPETVSRKLRQLREVGIADFRKDGRCVFNFLTPVAKIALSTLPEFSEGARTQHVSSRRKLLDNSKQQLLDNSKQQLRSSLSPYLQTNQTFSLCREIPLQENNHVHR